MIQVLIRFINTCLGEKSSPVFNSSSPASISDRVKDFCCSQDYDFERRKKIRFESRVQTILTFEHYIG